MNKNSNSLNPPSLTLESVVMSLLLKGIAENVFACASLLVRHQHHILLTKSCGRAQIYPEKIHFKNQLFDISSLTKPLATASLVIMAIAEKKLELDHPVGNYIPKVKGSQVTIKQLLNHSAGLPAWKPYHEKIMARHPDWMGKPAAKQWILEQIGQELENARPSDKITYSDLGYILLGHILETIWQQPLEQIFDLKIAKPFKLKNTSFPSLKTKTPEEYVATEDCPWRKHVLCGEVMDGTAYAMGGAAGHAGLFSNVHDINLWLCEIQKAKMGRSSLIAKNIIDEFTRIPVDRDQTKLFFTPGFDTPSRPSSSGSHFSPQSIGHLGFTGCSFWWDMKKDITIILLTNRCHPDRKNDKIRIFRPQLHDMIMEVLH